MLIRLLITNQIMRDNLIEDAAQSYGVKFNGIPVGKFGRFGCVSFHILQKISTVVMVDYSF